MNNKNCLVLNKWVLILEFGQFKIDSNESKVNLALFMSDGYYKEL